MPGYGERITPAQWERALIQENYIHYFFNLGNKNLSGEGYPISESFKLNQINSLNNGVAHLTEDIFDRPV